MDFSGVRENVIVMLSADVTTRTTTSITRNVVEEVIPQRLVTIMDKHPHHTHVCVVLDFMTIMEIVWTTMHVKVVKEPVVTRAIRKRLASIWLHHPLVSFAHVLLDFMMMVVFVNPINVIICLFRTE